MDEYKSIDYTKIELPEELLVSFAKAMAPEIRKFYQSDFGKKYYSEWMKKHTD